MPDDRRKEIIVAEWEGAAARNAGRDLGDNPYSFVSEYERHEAWLRAWVEAGETAPRG